MLEVNTYTVSILKTNCYLVKDVISGCGLIIDPGQVSPTLDADIKKCNKIEYILLTHGHFDHIYAATYYKNMTNAKIVIGKNDTEFTQNKELNLSHRFRRTQVQNFNADIFVTDNDKLKFCNKYISVIYTPGHTVGGVCYSIDNLLFTGDTLMNGSFGRTDLPTGNFEQLKISIQTLFKMRGDYVVYPGHGPITTLNNERK